ncbi:myosin heavy chain [Lentinula edodes]|uniref:Myosin heavy chain n=1 Tax=Lentinula edodes TaxID=5353 RepID=A0A1Q3E9W3_LENED|nr:myosin heavy chain [Lentinula edodes]
MYDQEFQDNRRPQSSQSQSNIPNNLPKLNFNYDNGNNTKTPNFNAEARQSAIVVGVGDKLAEHCIYLAASDYCEYKSRPATGTATSVAPTGPPTEFTYTPVSGVISRPHPPHQNHSSNQNQIRNQSTDTSQNPNTSSGIPHVPPGPSSVVHNTPHSSHGPPPATAPAVLVGPASGSSGSGSGKHLVGSSGSSNSFNGFQNAMNIGYFTQHRRASGSALGSHIIHNGLTASPQSANISPVSLHRVPASVGGPNFPGLGPSEGYAARSSANNEHATHPHMSPRQTHRAHPAPTSSAQSQHALPTPSIPFVPTPPLTTAQLSQGLHLIPSYPSHPTHPTSSNSASTAATAQTATQAILSTTQRTLEHTWNTILTSVDSEVAKLHTAHAGQIRVWADYVDGVRKESDAYKLRMESFQRDADRIRREREMYRLKSRDLENQIDEIRRRAESQRLPEVPEPVAHSQIELQEGRRKYEDQEDGSHDTEQTSNDLIDRLRRERDDLKMQVAGLATGSHPQNHSRSHSEHLQKLQNEHLSLSASYNTLLNAHSQLQATHTSLLATHNHLQITHTELRSTYDSCQTTYTALRREFEDLLEREEKARIKLGIAEESLKGERERAFELDEARKREKKGRKEREKEVEELRGKVYDLERHSTNGVRKETPDTFKETGPEENRTDSGQSQHEFQIATPIRPPSPQLRRSPHRQDVVNFDADDSVLPISPPPTGPSMLSPQSFSPPYKSTIS